MFSLEDRRLFNDELTVYKIHNQLMKTTLTQLLIRNIPMRRTRQNDHFYLVFVSTNIEYFAPMIRMQR